MQTSTSGGRTQETAAWLLKNVQARQVQSFAYPTGSGGQTVAVAAVAQWKEVNPNGVAIVISYVGQLAEQWQRAGMEAITRIRASRELKRDGTVLGHAPEQIGFVIVDGPSYDPGGHVSSLLAALPGATVLKMESGA
jgi:hypothetical protein